ncbi:MAG: hypothetical protein RL767_759, partial [Bacteroidota bacterium]
AMPVVSVTLLPGYAAETQHRMVNRLAQAVRSVIDTPEAGTTVFVNEVSTYRRDGKVFSEGRAAHPVASDLVRDYLQALQSGDLARAQSFLSPDFRMCFPGAVVMHTLQELVRLHRQGKSAREAAQLLNISRNTVRVYLATLQRAGLLDGPAGELPTLDVLKASIPRASPRSTIKSLRRRSGWLAYCWLSS